MLDITILYLLILLISVAYSAEMINDLIDNHYRFRTIGSTTECKILTRRIVDKLHYADSEGECRKRAENLYSREYEFISARGFDNCRIKAYRTFVVSPSVSVEEECRYQASRTLQQDSGLFLDFQKWHDQSTEALPIIHDQLSSAMKTDRIPGGTYVRSIREYVNSAEEIRDKYFSYAETQFDRGLPVMDIIQDGVELDVVLNTIREPMSVKFTADSLMGSLTMKDAFFKREELKTGVISLYSHYNVRSPDLGDRRPSGEKSVMKVTLWPYAAGILERWTRTVYLKQVRTTEDVSYFRALTGVAKCLDNPHLLTRNTSADQGQK